MQYSHPPSIASVSSCCSADTHMGNGHHKTDHKTDLLQMASVVPSEKAIYSNEIVVKMHSEKLYSNIDNNMYKLPLP